MRVWGGILILWEFQVKEVQEERMLEDLDTPMSLFLSPDLLLSLSLPYYDFLPYARASRDHFGVVAWVEGKGEELPILVKGKEKEEENQMD